MPSIKELEATLPLHPPEECARDVTLHNKWPVYSLVPLDDAGRERLLKDLNTGDMTTSNCCLAPQPDFGGRTLRDVYDYHIEIRGKDDNELHPDFLIVADQKDWQSKGVLLLHLQVSRETGKDEDEEEWKFEPVVGLMRCGVDMADCICCNLDIANVGWDEYKEEEVEQWGGEDCYKNKRYFKFDPTTGEENKD